MKVNDDLLKKAFEESTEPAGRASCPSSETLYELANHKLSSSERRQWLHHIAECSACASETKTLLWSETASSRKSRLPRAAFLLAAILVLAVAAGIYLFYSRVGKTEPLRIAFVDALNRTENLQLNAVGAMLSTSMEQSGKLHVISRGSLVDALKRSGNANISNLDEAAVRSITGQVSPNAIAVTTIDNMADGISIQLHLKDVKSGKDLFTGSAKVRELSDVPHHVDEISRSLRSHLEEDRAAVNNSKKISELTTENLNSYYHYFRGEDFLNRLNFAEAREELEKATRLDPTFAVAYYKLAFTQWTSEEPARDAIAKAMKNRNRAPRKEQNLIRAYYEFVNGRPKQAMRIYRFVLQNHPEEKEALYMAGDVSFHDGDYASAESYFRKVLSIDPSYGLAYDHLILIYESTHRYEPMLALAQKFVVKVGSERSYKLLADAYDLLGDFEHARQTYQSARKIFTGSSMPLIGVAEDVLVFQNRFQEADATTRALLTGTTDQKRQAFRSLSRILAYQGKYREALHACDQVILLDRELQDRAGLARAHAQKAFWLLALKQDRKGFLAEMESALQADTHSDDFLYIYLFQNYLLSDDFAEAEKVAKQNILAYGFYPDMLRSFQARRAGDPQRSVELLLALEQQGEPWSHLIRTRELALAYYDLGDYSSALKMFEKLIHTYSSYLGHRAAFYPEAMHYRAVVLEKMGEKKRAEEVRNTLREIWKNADSDLPLMKQLYPRKHEEESHAKILD